MDQEHFLVLLCHLIGTFLSIFMLICWISCFRELRLREDIPTSKIKSVFIGLVEVKGTPKPEKPLQGHLSEIPCLYSEWSVTEYFDNGKNSKIIDSYTNETFKDSDGKQKNRHPLFPNPSGGPILEGANFPPFYLHDETGIIRVNPEGAIFQVGMTVVLDRECGKNDPLYYGKGPTKAVPNSSFRRHFYEKIIPLHLPLYVIGTARERKDILAPEIAEKNESPFIITQYSEERFSRNARRALWIVGFLGWFFIILSWVIRDFWVLNQSIGQVWTFWFFPTGAYAGLLFLAWLWQSFNSLIDLRNRTNRAWSLVDIELKRRAVLIPHLIRTVEGIKGHEKEVQTTLTGLRQQVNTASESGVVGLASRIKLLIESYHDLKSVGNFAKLAKELSNTEDRIALAGGYFNDQASWQNTRLERIPEGWLAQLAGFKYRKLWSTTDLKRTLVEVHFEENGSENPRKQEKDL